jgi:hypothetical protein
MLSSARTTWRMRTPLRSSERSVISPGSSWVRVTAHWRVQYARSSALPCSLFTSQHIELPENTLAHAERWAAKMAVPGYAIDDQTAIKVTDGAVEVVSEGHWKLFTP